MSSTTMMNINMDMNMNMDMDMDMDMQVRTVPNSGTGSSSSNNRSDIEENSKNNTSTLTASQVRRMRLSGHHVTTNKSKANPTTETMRLHNHLDNHKHTHNSTNNDNSKEIMTERQSSRASSPSVKDLKRVFEFNQQTSIHSKTKSITFKSYPSTSPSTSAANTGNPNFATSKEEEDNSKDFMTLPAPMSSSNHEQNQFKYDKVNNYHNNGSSHNNDQVEVQQRTKVNNTHDNSPDEFYVNDKKKFNNHFSPRQYITQQIDNSDNHSNNNNSEIVNSSDINNSTSGGLSERRRKMALAKKHARSSTTSATTTKYNDKFDNNNENTTMRQNNKDSDFFVSFQGVNLDDDSGSITNNFKNNNNINDKKTKYSASPNRRRKFELVKGSIKHRRSNNSNDSLQPKEYDHDDHQRYLEHDQNQQHHQQQRYLQHPLVEEVSSIDKTPITFKKSNHKDPFYNIKTQKKSNIKNNTSTTQTLSTASLSTGGTFETFESDFNSFQQQQNYNLNSNINHHNMKPVGEIHDEIVARASTSSEIRWGIDDSAPSSQISRSINWNGQDNKKIDYSQQQHKQQQNVVSPMINQNSLSSRYFSSGTGIGGDSTHDDSNLNSYQIASVANDAFGEGISPGSYSNKNERPQYFAPVNGNTWDDDDETQFNSVTDNNDRKRPTRHVETVNVNIHPLQSTTLSTKSDKSFSYFTTGLKVGNSKKVFDIAEMGSNFRENDDESFNGSVGNQSWTGRMRATRAAQYNGSSTVDERYALYRLDSPSGKSVYSHDERNSEVKYFRPSQFLTQTRDIGSGSPAYVDATKGVEEFKKFATEDPTSAAIGVGVCGALCGALAFGPMGLVFAGATGAAIYGVSQMPKEKRENMKMKASSTVEKIKSKTEIASDYVTNNCGTCFPAEVPSKQVNEENDTSNMAITLRSTGLHVNSQIDTSDGVLNYSPKPVILNGPIGGGKHHELLMKKETNALLTQANKRQLSRMVPACCRMSRITPVNQIHSLDPSLHSRAWLDVMASAWTSRDEKNEAMEEILLLAKDKGRARMLLEEGILDSLMYILRAFFLSYAEKFSVSGQKALQIENFMADQNYFHSKLAANCCVALAKAHSAGAIDNSNDTSMSGGGELSSNTGLSLPVQKQVAQLLFEIPHHMAVVIDASGADHREKNERFQLSTELTKKNADDLAASITALTLGNIEMESYLNYLNMTQ